MSKSSQQDVLRNRMSLGMDIQDRGHLLVIGASSVDIKGRASQPLLAGTSTSGVIRASFGGVGRNIAENLARLGEEVVLLSAVGDDDPGRYLLQHACQCGIDTNHVLVESSYQTAAYLSVLDHKGNQFTSIHDMGIIRRVLTPSLMYRKRVLFRDARLLVIDSNLSPRTLRTVFGLARRYNVPVCADPTTAPLAVRLKPYLGQLLLVTPNAVEAESLSGVRVADRDSALTAAQVLIGMGVQIAVVTLGPTGLVYARSQESGHVPAIAVDIVDFTGAGDALTAAIAFGLLHEFPVDEAVRLGVSAAALALQSRESVCTSLSLERLYDQLLI